MLQSFLKIPVQVHGFQGQWNKAPKADVTCIGTIKGQWNALGRTTILGNKTWNQMAGIRIDMGPVNLDVYTALLPHYPDNRLYLKIVDLCKMYLKGQFHITFKPILSDALKPSTHLGDTVMLGDNTWVNGSQTQHAA
jgi:type VI secretion system protein ImpH